MTSPVVSFQTFGLQGPAGLIDPMLYPKAMQVGSAVGAQQGTMLGNIAKGIGEGIEKGVGIANTVANIQQTQAETANLPTPEQAKRQTEADIGLKESQAAYYNSRAGDGNSPAQQAANQNKINSEFDKQVISKLNSLSGAGFGDQLAEYVTSKEAMEAIQRSPEISDLAVSKMRGAGLFGYDAYNQIADIDNNHKNALAMSNASKINTERRTSGIEGLTKEFDKSLVDITPFIGQRENFASVELTSDKQAKLDNGKVTINPTAAPVDFTNGGKAYFRDKNTGELLGEVPINSSSDYIDLQKKLRVIQSYQASDPSTAFLYRQTDGLSKRGVGTTATAFESLSSDPQKRAVDAAIDADRANIPLSDTVQKQIQNLPPDAQLPAQRAAQKTAAIAQADKKTKAKIAVIDSKPYLKEELPVWKALSFVETDEEGKDASVSETGVKGPFQISTDTFKQYQKNTPLLEGKTREDPEASLLVAKMFMADLTAMFKGDTTSALAAYNGGPGVIKEAQRLAGSTDFNVYKDYLEDAIRKSPDKYYQKISNDPEKLKAQADQIRLYPYRFYEALQYF